MIVSSILVRISPPDNGISRKYLLSDYRTTTEMNAMLKRPNHHRKGLEYHRPEVMIIGKYERILYIFLTAFYL